MEPYHSKHGNSAAQRRHHNAASVIITLLLLAAGAGTAHAQATPPEVTLCFVARARSTGALAAYAASAHTVEVHRDAFPLVAWRHRPLGRNGNVVVKDAVQAIVANGSDCDVLLGPGSSTYATAMSPIVDVPWLEFAATLDDLADDAQHPFFSRVIPADGYLSEGIARLILGFGWRAINTLCINEPYGRNVVQRVAREMVNRGGSVVVSACVEIDADDTAIATALDILERSDSRIVAVGAASPVPAYQRLVTAIHARGLHHRKVFVFSESACSGNAAWRELPGALCMTYRTEAAVRSAFLRSFEARDTRPAVAALDAIGGGPINASTFVNTLSVFGAFAHDAVLLTMSAVSRVVATNGSAALRDRAALRDAIRATVLDVRSGMTGEVRLSATGERTLAALQVISVLPNNEEEAKIGVLYNGTVYATVGSNENETRVDRLPAVHWLAARVASSIPPVDVLGSGTPENPLSMPLIFAAAGAVVLVVLLTLCFCAGRRNPDALRRLLSGGFVTQALSVCSGVAVVVVKLLVTISLFLDGAAVGYLVGYTLFVATGVVSIVVDMITKLQLLLAAMRAGDDGVGFDDEVVWAERVKVAAVVNAVMSDAPTVVVTALMLLSDDEMRQNQNNSSSTGSTSGQLLMVLIIASAVMFGAKVNLVPDVLRDLARRTAGGGDGSATSSALNSSDDGEDEFLDGDDVSGGNPLKAGGGGSSADMVSFDWREGTLTAMNNNNNSSNDAAGSAGVKVSSPASPRMSPRPAFASVQPGAASPSEKTSAGPKPLFFALLPPAANENDTNGTDANAAAETDVSIRSVDDASESGGKLPSQTAAAGKLTSPVLSNRRVSGASTSSGTAGNAAVAPPPPIITVGPAVGTAKPSWRALMQRLRKGPAVQPPQPPQPQFNTSSFDGPPLHHCDSAAVFTPRVGGSRRPSVAVNASFDGRQQQQQQQHGHHHGAGGRAGALSSSALYALQQLGRRLALTVREERVRTGHLLDVVLPELLQCFNATPDRVARSRLGKLVAAAATHGNGNGGGGSGDYPLLGAHHNASSGHEAATPREGGGFGARS